MNAILQKFCSRLASLGLSVFAQDKAPVKDGWITVKPNGPEHKGQHVEIDDETGGVKKGFGGKFKGQKISEIKSGFRGPQVNRLTERPDRKPEPKPMRTPAPQTSAGQKLGGRLQDVLQKRQQEMEKSQPAPQSQQPTEPASKPSFSEIEDRPIEKEKFRDKFKDASSEVIGERIQQLLNAHIRHLAGVASLTDQQYENLRNELSAARAAERRLHLSPKEVAGTKAGKPMTLSEADGSFVNPKFHRGGNYRINCQSCTLAYELRCRGFNVEARPRGGVSRGGSGDLGTKLSRGSMDAYIDPETGWPVDRISVACKDSTNEKDCKDMLRKIDSIVKPGERYAMRCTWKGKKSGHIFNLAKDKNGHFYLIDSQCGDFLPGIDNMYKDYFAKCSQMEDIRICRTDNAQITGEFAGVLKKSRSKPY